MKKIITLSLLLCSSLASAMSSEPAQVNLPDSKVVLTNSTLDPVSISLRVQFDSSLHNGTHYRLVNTEIPPLATREVLSFSRTNGIQNNKQYRYSVDVQSAGSQFTLLQDVVGKGNGDSELRFGANASGVSVAPQTNRNIQRHNTQFNGPAILGFNAESNNNADQVNYVIQAVDQKPALGAANQLNVLSYNIWATTIFGSTDVSTRLEQMPEVLSGYDVVVGTEYFDDVPSDNLRASVRAEYPYQTGKAFKVGKLLESGTRILSRWPIEREEYHFYEACNGIQCPASRAVIYTRINKQGNRYHVFATHTQSSDDDPNRQARLSQLQEMANYVSSLNLPANEPVVFAGDFNVNKIGLPQDRDLMVSLLNATEPQNLGYNLTFDSTTNHWAGGDYQEFLDYTLYSNINLNPVSATQEVFAPRSLVDALWKKWDLSDHYAVRGLFSYPTAAQPARPGFPYAGDIVHFKTHNGHFMRAMSGGGSFISAGSDNLGTWESFKVIGLDNGKIALQARDGHYIGLDSYLLGTLKADKHSIREWEQFELVQLGNGKVAIKAANGKYFKADFAGGAGLTASAGAIDSWETFEMIRP